MLSGSLPAENFCLACLSVFLLECQVGESETESGEMVQPGSYLKSDLGTSEAAPSSVHLGFSQVQARLVGSRGNSCYCHPSWAIVADCNAGSAQLVQADFSPDFFLFFNRCFVLGDVVYFGGVKGIS